MERETLETLVLIGVLAGTGVATYVLTIPLRRIDERNQALETEKTLRPEPLYSRPKCAPRNYEDG
ncbi:MAG: hypothetical protein AABX04_01885 [Nanoarchaeota archaeon]